VFAWLELKTHCHATEDEAKVARSLQALFPGAKPQITKTAGFHKNPILVISARTERAKDIKEFWRLMDSSGLVGRIVDSLKDEVDEGGLLHLRLGKQEAYLGKPAIARDEDAIVVRMRIARRPGAKATWLDEARDSIRGLLEKHVPGS